MLVGFGFEVKALNVHSVYDELLIPLFPLYMDQCTKMLVLGLDTNQLVGTTQQLNRYAKLVYNYSRRDKNL
jgi:hypothetical protein